MELTRDEQLLLHRLQRVDLSKSTWETVISSVPPFLKTVRRQRFREEILALAAAGMVVIEDWDYLKVSLTEQGRAFEL